MALKNYKKIWEKDTEYGNLLYKRATGKLPEMFSSVALCNILKKIYKKGMKLLDVGCGGGHYLRSLQERVDTNINYLGIDITERYIELARRAFDNDKLFEVGDIFNLKVKDNEFDIVVSNNVILHLPPNPIKAISELIRVSKKFIIIRTVFGERNYIIQEIKIEQNIEAQKIHSKTVNKKIFLEDGTPKVFNYFNLYTEDYFRTTIAEIVPNAKVDVANDSEFDDFDNKEITTNTGTKAFKGIQVSGNLMLDWRFIIITK